MSSLGERISDHLADVRVCAKTLVPHGDVEVVIEGCGRECVVDSLDIERDRSGPLAASAVGVSVDGDAIHPHELLQGIADEFALLRCDDVHADLAQGMEGRGEPYRAADVWCPGLLPVREHVGGGVPIDVHVLHHSAAHFLGLQPRKQVFAADHHPRRSGSIDLVPGEHEHVEVASRILVAAHRDREVGRHLGRIDDDERTMLVRQASGKKNNASSRFIPVTG